MLLLRQRWDAEQGAVRTARLLVDKFLRRLRADLAVRDAAALALSELWTNALKHSAQKPDFFELEIERKDGGFYFSLMDNASSFDDFARNLTESQHRLSVFRDQDQGLDSGGLGLALAREAFENVTSTRRGDVNCFAFFLDHPARRQPLVLVVEDDPLQADLMGRYLQDDFRVQSCLSAAAAAEFLDRETPDLIICDVLMPDGDGVAFAEQLRRDKKRAAIPFVFMTGNPERSLSQTAATLAINAFVTKPVNKRDLRELLTRILERRALEQSVFVAQFERTVTNIMTPHNFGGFGDFDTALHSHVAEAGGGDFLFVVSSPHGDQHLVIMDVMGHGVQAKFFGLAFAGYLRGVIAAQAHYRKPGDILAALSDFLWADDLGAQSLVTLQILTLSPDGQLAIASAGHPAPCLLTAKGGQWVQLDGGMPGLCPHTDYQSFPLPLAAGDRLVLMTDGILEPADQREKSHRYADNILKKAAARHRDAQTVQDFVAQLWDDVTTEQNLKDDALLAVLEKKHLSKP